MKVHVWCPGICGVGGIEAYSYQMVDALAEILPDAKLKVIARNDTAVALRSHLPSRVTAIGMGNFPNTIRIAAFAAEALLHAVVDRPDLIFVTHLNFGPIAFRLKRFQGTRYWISLHGIEAWQISRRSRTRAVTKADLLLSVSRFTRDRAAAQLAISQSSLQILPDSFDAETLRPGRKSPELLQRYGLTDKHRVILTVGRLSQFERYKGHDRIVRALPTVKAAIADVRYLIVGDGDDRGRIEQLTRESGVSDSVIFCGAVGGDELADHYRLCDVFAMPSTGEGFGIVFLEALACGKPVIAGNKDASADPLLHGELGILIDPDDRHALASQLIEVLSGRSSHSLIYRPEELRRRAIERFGPQAFRSRLEEILREQQLTPSLSTS